MLEALVNAIRLPELRNKILFTGGVLVIVRVFANNLAITGGAEGISGADAFQLHDTYGFPIDLTLEMAAEQGLAVDGEGFRRLMAEQRAMAKADAQAKKTAHVDLSAYRIIQEGLTNALKHAHASHADVTVRYRPGELEIEVRDDGQGGSTRNGLGHGLVGVRERVKIYGGEMTAGTVPDSGFVLSTRLPLQGERP